MQRVFTNKFFCVIIDVNKGVTNMEEFIIESHSGPSTLKREKGLCWMLFSVMRYIALNEEDKCEEKDVLEEWLDNPNPSFGLLSNTEKNLKQFFNQFREHYDDYKNLDIINVAKSTTINNGQEAITAWRNDSNNRKIFSVDTFINMVMKNDGNQLVLKSVDELNAIPRSDKERFTENFNGFVDMLRDYEPKVEMDDLSR